MSTAPRLRRSGLFLASLAACGAALVLAQDPAAPALPPDDPAILPAQDEPLVARSLLLDVCDAANRGIAVGERGHILVSPSRRDWTQVRNVPTRATLTACTAVGDHAWAVGHDGVILHSADGGQTWERQRVAPYDPQSDDPHNGVPLLDVMFLDEKHGIAIGAYALMLKTEDGGATWIETPLTTPPAAAAADDVAAADDAAAAGGVSDEDWTMSEEEVAIGEETDPHLNAIARTGDGYLFIVAERGAAFRSVDGGDSWERIKLDYEGSMFGVIGYEGRHVLAYGLRGNVFESLDLGDTWSKVETGTDLSIMGGTGWTGGGAALVGANGIVLTRSADGQGLLKHVHPDSAVLSTALALAPGGELVVVGENGVGTYTPN